MQTCFKILPVTQICTLYPQSHKELLTESSFSGGRGNARVDDRRKKSHGGHDGVSLMAEGDRLECERAQGRLLQVPVLDGQLQEMEDAFVLGPRPDVMCHFVPIVTMKFKSLRRERDRET